MPHWIKVAIISMAACVTSSCVTSPEHILQQNGPTMAQLITSNTVDPDVGDNQKQQRVPDRESLVAYTRTAENEIEQLFPMLDNPTISIYVYPHLSTSSGAPVPGYTTAIKLYPADVYALPGERVVTD